MKMIQINEYDKKLIEDISKLTVTDYEVKEMELDIKQRVIKYYCVPIDNILRALDDLKQEYDHLLEMYEEIRNGEE